jgi:hypothetical protein
MKLYKVYLDLTLVINRLKKFTLKEFNSTTPIVFIEAKSPDDACFKAIYKLIKILLDHDDSMQTRLLCREIKHDVKITKVIVE